MQAKSFIYKEFRNPLFLAIFYFFFFLLFLKSQKKYSIDFKSSIINILISYSMIQNVANYSYVWFRTLIPSLFKQWENRVNIFVFSFLHIGVQACYVPTIQYGHIILNNKIWNVSSLIFPPYSLSALIKYPKYHQNI